MSQECPKSHAGPGTFLFSDVRSPNSALGSLNSRSREGLEQTSRILNAHPKPSNISSGRGQLRIPAKLTACAGQRCPHLGHALVWADYCAGACLRLVGVIRGSGQLPPKPVAELHRADPQLHPRNRPLDGGDLPVIRPHGNFCAVRETLDDLRSPEPVAAKPATRSPAGRLHIAWISTESTTTSACDSSVSALASSRISKRIIVRVVTLRGNVKLRSRP